MGDQNMTKGKYLLGKLTEAIKNYYVAETSREIKTAEEDLEEAKKAIVIAIDGRPGYRMYELPTQEQCIKCAADRSFACWPRPIIKPVSVEEFFRNFPHSFLANQCTLLEVLQTEARWAKE